MILSAQHFQYALALAPSFSTPRARMQKQQSSSSGVVLAGKWVEAKLALRDPECCVVSVSGLEDHLRVLQQAWQNAPSDVDLRARVRVASSLYTYEDCWKVRHAVTPLPTSINNIDNETKTITEQVVVDDDPISLALQELACGVASMADGPFESMCDGVLLRIVCASHYQARDPMFHTDKAPLRRYVTLKGPGTDFMIKRCTPWEYMTLRALGTLPNGGMLQNTLKRAKNLEFIVMKGDHYEYKDDNKQDQSANSKIFQKEMRSVWQRSLACVHRSPPTKDSTCGVRRRVIVSLDLMADGRDDREWYDAGKKRTWRSGMTQRKSRLVA
jgi:hypothetical protein